jgi:hypothetical protein
MLSLSAPPSRSSVIVPGMVPSSAIESSRSAVATSILVMPAPGQVAVWLSTITQVPLGVRVAAASVIV